MKWSLISPEELGVSERERWAQIRESNPCLDSPFFSSRFVLSVGKVRKDVRIAVVEDGARIAGFFPHQRTRRGEGRPVGGPLSDFQGVIAEDGFQCDASELLKHSQLRSWRFDHLAPNQKVFWPHVTRFSASRSIDVSAGFDAYAASRRQTGSHQVADVLALERRLVREHGPIEFRKCDRSPDALRQLLQWKSAQYLRSGLVDAFEFRWMVRLIESLLAPEEDHCSGLLSTLCVAGRLIAAHAGIRERSVWHYWVTAYDPAFRRYSPGLVLLMAMARSAPEMGICRIDLGKGDELYKRRCANREVEVGQGEVGRLSASFTRRMVGGLTERRLPGCGPFLAWARRYLDQRETRRSYR